MACRYDMVAAIGIAGQRNSACGCHSAVMTCLPRCWGGEETAKDQERGRRGWEMRCRSRCNSEMKAVRDRESEEAVLEWRGRV